MELQGELDPQVCGQRARRVEVDSCHPPDDEMIYVILDNLSAHKGTKFWDWAELVRTLRRP